MRHIRAGIATSLTVGTPFVIDRVFPHLHSPLLLAPLDPGIYLTGFVFNLFGGSAFDKAGDLRPAFVFSMVGLSAIFWFAAFHGAGALCKHAQIIMQRRRGLRAQ